MISTDRSIIQEKSLVILKESSVWRCVGSKSLVEAKDSELELKGHNGAA